MDTLTPRQRDVLALLVWGLRNKEIARRLGIGESSVKEHLSAVYARLGVHNRTGAVMAVLRGGG